MATTGDMNFGEVLAETLQGNARANPRGHIEYFNDFTNFAVEEWTSTTDGGTSLGRLAVGGWVSIITDSTIEDEACLASKSKPFIFNTTKRLYFGCRVNVASTTTANASNFAIGLGDALADGADVIADAGANVVATYDGALFAHLDLGTSWIFNTSNAASQVENTSLATYTEAEDITLEFVYDPNDGTTGKIIPMVNGVDKTTHDITISGLVGMGITMYVKAGEGVAQVDSFVDWVHVIQER